MAQIKRAPAACGAARAQKVKAEASPSNDTAKNENQAPSKWRSLYRVHPAADVFPMMSHDEIDELKEDIKANGLLEGITLLHQGHGLPILLDGRNRLEAMERAGVAYTDQNEREERWLFNTDPISTIISLNIKRRHLTKRQQADLIVAAVRAGQKPPQLEEVSKGGRGKVNKVKAKAVAEAKEHGISKATVERAFEKASDHPNAPKPLRQKAARQRSKAAAASRMAPSTIEGWRGGYINACAVLHADLDAERGLLNDAFKEIVGKRFAARHETREGGDGQ